MTRKDSEKDSERPHYYSQFWLDVAAGRRVIGMPKEAAEDEVQEPAAPAGKASRAEQDGAGQVMAGVNGDISDEETSEADFVAEEEEEFIEPEEEEFEEVEELIEPEEQEDEGIPDVDLEEEEEDFYDDEEEEEEEEDDIGWGGRGRKKPKPGRAARTPQRKSPGKRDTRRSY
ncbi:MAG: hypothetical protein J2P36_05085 [Ktedonobacteraceae bacterium]|nr:hypothetical protein [Ktedonobacteraceae bacterium]